MLLMIRLAKSLGGYLPRTPIAYAFVSIFLIEVVNLVVFYDMSPKRVLSQHPLANVVQGFPESFEQCSSRRSDAIRTRPLPSSRSAVCKLW